MKAPLGKTEAKTVQLKSLECVTLNKALKSKYATHKEALVGMRFENQALELSYDLGSS